jgi:hypothetical protein
MAVKTGIRLTNTFVLAIPSFFIEYTNNRKAIVEAKTASLMTGSSEAKVWV